MLYSCTHMATVGFKGLIWANNLVSEVMTKSLPIICWNLRNLELMTINRAQKNLCLCCIRLRMVAFHLPYLYKYTRRGHGHSQTGSAKWQTTKEVNSYGAHQPCTLRSIKNCTLLTGTITLQYYAILWWFVAYRCTWEYLIACLFDSLCKIVNWEPAYQICHCLLSSRQQCKMWNSCCNARPQTSSLQTYGFLTVLNLILCITGYVEY